MITELSREAAEKLLSEQKNAHLGCVLADGSPYIVPVNYLFRDNLIYVHTLPGRKLDAMRENPKVCLQVERVEDTCRWQSVIIFGEFFEMKKINEKIEIMREFAERFERLTPVEAMIKEKWNSGGVIIFRIKINGLTGMAEN